MRIYTSATEMLDETGRELFKRGQSVFDKTVQGKIVSEVDFEQKELISYSYMLKKFEDMDEMLAKAKELFGKEHITSHIGHVWFDDMMDNPTLHENWWDETEYTKKYFKDFCDEGNGNASYSYGERVMPYVKPVLDRLKSNLYSRGAIIQLFKPEDSTRIGRRVPCTMNYHFIARRTIDGDQLNLIINQRSADFINFFALDLYKGYLLLDWYCKQLNVRPGYIIHNVGSLHVYKKDLPANYTW